MKSILHNKYVLYAVFILALIDFLYLGYIQDMKSVFIFVLVGILVTFFNKNMIIVLGLAVIVTHVIKIGNIIPTKEGFTDDDKEDDDTEDDDKKKKKRVKKGEDDDEEHEDKEEKEHEEEEKEKDENKEKTKEDFGQDKEVVYTSAEDQSFSEQDKMILANEKLLKRMNKYKPLLDTLSGLTKNIAIVKGFASAATEDK